MSSVPYTSPALWRALTQAGYFVGLSGVIGATVTYAAAVRPVLRGPAADRSDAEVLRRRTATYLAWSGVVLLVAGYGQLAARVARAGAGMPFGSALAPVRIRDFLTAPARPGDWVSSGTLYLVQNVVLLLAAATLVALFFPAARRHLDAVALTALPLSLGVTLIAAIPTAAPKNADSLVGTLLTQVHIIGGTVWVGGLALLAALAGARRRLGHQASLAWAELWRRFGLVALVCVGSVLISGLWLAWKHVGTVEQLFTTGYGLFLVVKIVLVLGMIAAGAVNQFWLMPRVARARRADETASAWALTLRHFPKVVWAEVALGAGVLAIVPFLTGSARAQAGSRPAPALDGGIFAIGALLAVTLAVSLYATTRASDALSRRPAAEATSP